MSKAKTPRGFWFHARVFKSKAYRSLSPTARDVYLLICSKRLVVRRETPKRREFTYPNNGNIILTYKQIEAELGCSVSTITRAIDRLVDVGLVDVTPGAGMEGSASRYATSERYQHYGTPAFQESKREKDRRAIGWRKSARAKRKDTSLHGDINNACRNESGSAEPLVIDISKRLKTA